MTGKVLCKVCDGEMTLHHDHTKNDMIHGGAHLAMHGGNPLLALAGLAAAGIGALKKKGKSYYQCRKCGRKVEV